MLSKKRVLALAILAIVGLLPVSNAVASIDGPYLGAEVGWGNIHQTNVSGLTTTSSISTGIAGRGFGGFQFSPHFAIEGGYTKYYDGTVNGVSDFVSYASTTFNSYSIDLLAKAILPMEVGIDIYGKIGAAYLSQTATSNGTTIGTPDDPAETFRVSTTVHKVFPAFGVGASYNFDANIAADISWLHIQHIGDNTLRNTDFVGIGMIYNFG